MWRLMRRDKSERKSGWRGVHPYNIIGMVSLTSRTPRFHCHLRRAWRFCAAIGKARSKGDYRMPSPLYEPNFGSPLLVDQSIYGRLGSEVERRALVDSFIVPIRSGKAWPVLAGHVCRIV